MKVEFEIEDKEIKNIINREISDIFRREYFPVIIRKHINELITKKEIIEIYERVAKNEC